MKRIMFLSLMVLLLINSVFSFGQKENKGMAKIIGVPGIYGTEPHTYVCIKAETGKVYYVHPNNQKEIRDRKRGTIIIDRMDRNNIIDTNADT